MTANEIEQTLKQIGSPEKALQFQRFFKTGPGEYGAGDVFLGINVPILRQLARKHKELALEETLKLLKSQFHELRTLAILILVLRYAKENLAGQKRIYNLYLGHTHFINNWDLVDISAPHIVGNFLATRDRHPIYKLAESKSLWERRIAIMATFHFIRQSDFADTFNISKRLLNDKEDLIHKAVGWMLREVGKRNQTLLESFLKEHYLRMPRTMLRYAIERFPEMQRKRYLIGNI